MIRSGALIFAAVVAAFVIDCAAAASTDAGEAAAPAQQDFASPGEAASALVAAVRANDPRRTLQVLGSEGEKLIHSGDPVADRRGRERLVSAYDKAHRVQAAGDDAATLVVGAENWSLPIPIVKRDGRWHFDTVASAQKIIDRRVGRNELNVIEVCRAYVIAQREYAAARRAAGAPREYAQRLQSSPGQRDGLFWEAAAGETPSPFGPLMAKARAQGYADQDHAPYHGYFYRILPRQGAHAPGGARDYVVDGHMTKGFALLAFPARWADSGIMTFIVSQDGIVFQKNLGPDTADLAAAITEYDPDPSWTVP